VQGDLELEGDGAARERAGPDASHLLAVAERADAFLSEVGPPRLFDWERVRERAKERERERKRERERERASKREQPPGSCGTRGRRRCRAASRSVR